MAIRDGSDPVARCNGMLEMAEKSAPYPAQERPRLTI